jgi:putative DNA primase/helicase
LSASSNNTPSQDDRTTRSMLAVALAMASRGWRVFPVYPPTPEGTCPCNDPNCGSAGKHPAIKQWQDRATTDTDRVTDWWTSWPDHNVGIATGRESNLLVLDIDGALGRGSVAGGHPIPDGPTVSTGREDGGVHHYFTCPDDFDARNFAGKIPGLDARANGGYVIASGSLHKSGRHYEWINDSETRPLPGPPEWLVDMLKQRRPAVGHVGARIPNGQRNDTLFSLARTMSRRGFAEGAILEAIRIENDQKCDDPLPDADLVRIVESAVRYGPDPILLTQPLTDAGNAERFARLWGDTTRYCVEDKTWLHSDTPGFEGLWKADSPKTLHHKLVETARQFQITAAAMPAATDEQRAIRKTVLEFSQKLENDHFYRAMRRMVESHLAISVNDFVSDPECLPCLNGVVDLRTGELMPPGTGGLHRHHSPVNYETGYTDPVLEQFLEDATKGVPGMAEALQIRAGYYATGYTREEGLDFFVGPGGGGKSTLSEAIRAALGGFGVAMDAESFMKQDLSSKGHTDDLMQMEGRRFAVVQEPDQRRQMRIGLLKKLSGSDMMSGRRIYQGEREFRNTAKLVFVFNKSPELPVDDSGMQRRLWVWPFNNGRDGDERDHSIKTHLVDSEEGRMAILAWIVEGARKYLALHQYPVPGFVQSKTKELWEANDVIATFIEEQCITEPGASTQYTPLWEAFERWNRREGGQAVKGTDFREWLDAHGYVTKRTNGVTRRVGICYAGDEMVFQSAQNMEGMMN